MQMLVLALCTLLFATAVSVRQQSEAQLATLDVDASVAAASFHIVTRAAGQHAVAHPESSGELDELALREFLPSWFAMPDQIRVIRHRARTLVVLQPSAGVSIASLFDKRHVPAASIGTVRGGRLISPAYSGTLAFDLPESMPEGAIVYVI